MARVKRGVTAHAKHKKVLEQAKGFYGRRKNTIRTAKAAVDKAGQYAYRDRKVRKRQFRSLWIQRINAAARVEGLVVGADFFSRPEAAGAATPGAADLRRYTITVEDNGRSRTLELTDPVDDPALNALIDSLRGAGRAGHGN